MICLMGARSTAFGWNSPSSLRASLKVRKIQMLPTTEDHATDFPPTSSLNDRELNDRELNDNNPQPPVGCCV